MLTKSTLIAALSAFAIVASMPAAYASVDHSGRNQAVQTDHSSKTDRHDRREVGGSKFDKRSDSRSSIHDRSADKGTKDRSASRDTRSGK